tara:strand:- start:278 stop:481 length:204 start_codon:yes stop_codon:yes gene_type:complete
MKTFDTFVENVEELRQKALEKKELKKQAELQRKAEQEDDEKLAQDTASAVGDDIKRKLKSRYNIDID